MVQTPTLALVNTWWQDSQHTVRNSFYGESPLSEGLWVARMAEHLKMLACKPHSKLRIQSLGDHMVKGETLTSCPDLHTCDHIPLLPYTKTNPSPARQGFSV